METSVPNDPPFDDELEALKSVTVLHLPEMGHHITPNVSTASLSASSDVQLSPFRLMVDDMGLRRVFISASTAGDVVTVPQQGDAVVWSPRSLLMSLMSPHTVITCITVAPDADAIFVATHSASKGVHIYHISPIDAAFQDARAAEVSSLSTPPSSPPTTRRRSTVTTVFGEGDTKRSSRGFVDGSQTWAEFGGPVPLMSYFFDIRQGVPVLAVCDAKNYAIRLIALHRLAIQSDSTNGGRDVDVRTICGCGVPGYCDGRVSTGSMLREVTGLLWTSDGCLLFSDGPNHAIRMARFDDGKNWMSADACEVTTVVGGSSKRFGLADGSCATSLCKLPAELSPGPAPESFIFADRGNHAVRIVDCVVNTVRTLVTTEDYEGGAPVPKGLQDVTQVFAMVLKDDPVATEEPGSVALLACSRTTRCASLIVTASLPLPTKRRESEGPLALANLYGVATALPRVSDLRVRTVVLSKAPPGCGVRQASERHLRNPTTYSELLQKQPKATSRSRSPAARGPSPDPRGGEKRIDPIGLAAGGGVDRISAVPRGAKDANTLENPTATRASTTSVGADDEYLRFIYEAYANKITKRVDAASQAVTVSVKLSSVAEEERAARAAVAETMRQSEWSMRLLSFWAFCVTAGLTERSERFSSISDDVGCYDAILDQYQKSWVRDGYKVLCRMPFTAFRGAIESLFAHTRSVSQAQAADAVQECIRQYCRTVQNPEFVDQLAMLDVIQSNEASLLRIFDAYANSVDRGTHVGRIPYLRFQSMLHAVRVFPHLITQSHLKRIFGEASFLHLFALKSEPKAADVELEKKVLSAWKDTSLNTLQFVEAVIRVAMHCFCRIHSNPRAESPRRRLRVSTSTKAATVGKAHTDPINMSKDSIGTRGSHGGVTASTSTSPSARPMQQQQQRQRSQSLAAVPTGTRVDEQTIEAVEQLFRWMNVEMELMAPSTEIQERNRQSNHFAGAVFPPKVPLFRCRVTIPSSQEQRLPHHDVDDELQHDLRRLRRSQDSRLETQ